MEGLIDSLQTWQQSLPKRDALTVSGKLVQSLGMLLEAEGCKGALGSICIIESAHNKKIKAEIIGFRNERVLLMPLESGGEFTIGARVIPLGEKLRLQIGQGLIGRVINALGEPLDGLGPLKNTQAQTLQFSSINPLKRKPIKEVLDIGVQSINALLTIGIGQRIGLFAGSGVGKSVLLGMMARHSTADVIVVGLIGERGREVKEFIDEILGTQGLKKAVVVVAPADESAMLRLYGAETATVIAEYFRNQGKNVLLLMDSLTRYAQAQREISLAAGEPPATKGYTPSVFAKLPALVERAGNGEDQKGSITALYTVLVEGDDTQEPIADAARAILDGHIVLNRKIAEQGIYPAIDVEASISRVMTAIVTPQQLADAQKFKRLSSSYQQNSDLLRIGAYKSGTDPELDEAIFLRSHMRNFMTQSMLESASYKDSLASLDQLLKTTRPKQGSQQEQNQK